MAVKIDMQDELLTVKDVVEMAGISRYTLTRDIKNRKILAIYFGKNVRFRREDAEKYAEAKRNSRWAGVHRCRKNTTQAES